MRKRTLLIALTILAFAIIGTILSTFYTENESDFAVSRVSYGFPLGWYGYSEQIVSLDGTMVYWYSAGFFLIDTAFWFAISSLVVIATMKSVNMLRKTRASKKLSVIKVQDW